MVENNKILNAKRTKFWELFRIEMGTENNGAPKSRTRLGFSEDLAGFIIKAIIINISTINTYKKNTEFSFW
jgi:hypothetical protein